MTREEMRAYALKVSMPLLQRTADRSLRGVLSYKPDQHGYAPSYLENLCRPLWGLAPLLAESEEINVTLDGKPVPLGIFLRDQLLAGLSHGTDKSWDRYKADIMEYAYENQSITELAGLAVCLFFARRQLWDPLSAEDKASIAKGITEMAKTAFRHSWPNNHYWFPLFAFTVLKRFGLADDETEQMIRDGLSYLDKMYIGGGWYKDGEFGRFDYYEAWSHHLYPLLWTMIADSSFPGYEERCEAYRQRTNEFLPFFSHWFDENGANVPFGRSLNYRFAASALFPVAVLAGCSVDPALAGRITEKNINFFRSNFHFENGELIEEGYMYHSPATVEGYASDGAAYWCAKTFLALLLPPEHPFWVRGGALLPSETSDYTVVPAQPDIHLVFQCCDGLVTMYNNSAQYYLNGLLTHHFGDMRAWYGKFVYASAAGFGCSAPDKVSYDGMISLMTADETMESHRVGWQDLGVRDGVLHSRHIPFANDPDTSVETWLIPRGWYHVRIHRVTLSRPYIVREGGFSLGRWDDECPVTVRDGAIYLSNKQYVSGITAAASVPLRLKTEMTHANHHLYAPLASYPAWTTGLLPAGEYRFVTAVGLRKKGKEMTFPQLDGFHEDDCR